MGHSASPAILSKLQGHSQFYIEGSEPLDNYDYEINIILVLQYTRAFSSRGLSQGKKPVFKMWPMHIRRAPSKWAQLAREFDTIIVWQYQETPAVGEFSYKYFGDSSVIEGLRKKGEVRLRCKHGVGC